MIQEDSFKKNIKSKKKIDHLLIHAFILQLTFIIRTVIVDNLQINGSWIVSWIVNSWIMG